VALIEELHSDLLAHIQKEEQVLFPFIAQMDQELVVTILLATLVSDRSHSQFS